MKLLLSLCISVLCAILLLNVMPVHGEEELYSETVRLHVIAQSDSEDDQKLKLEVRDAVLRLLEEELTDELNVEAAEQKIERILGDIELEAEKTLIANGCGDAVKAELVYEEYPTRYYEGFTLPSGMYRSLKITIGEGEGRNWWCILFPSVCISDAVSAENEYIEAGFTPEQYRIIDNASPRRYKVRFKILEILSDIVGFEY